MFKNGRLFVFVLKDELTNEIRAICDDMEIVKKELEAYENWGFGEVKIDCYRVKTMTDYRFVRSA